jgi:hypothetical protein
MASNRPRGFADWRPHQKTRDLLAQIQQVLETYRDQLPVTGRQVFYRLVAKFGYAKTDSASQKLGEVLNRARRAGLVPMDAIRDDGVVIAGNNRFEDGEAFLDNCRYWAKGFELDLQQDQPQHVEILCEARGMVPQLNRVASLYGIPVRSSGGFDSTTVKHQLGKFYGEMGKRVVVLHIGDLDPSGHHIHLNLQDDVGAFARHYGGSIDVQRIAVTPEQQAEHNLPTDVPKKDDAREFPFDFTVQAEALAPDVMVAIVRDAIERNVDLDVWQLAVERQAEIRDQLKDALDGISLL